MNIIATLAVALELPLADLCGIGTTVHASHVLRWTAGRSRPTVRQVDCKVARRVASVIED